MFRSTIKIVGFFVSVCVLCVFLVGRRVRATFDEHAFSFGAAIMRLSGSQEASRTIHLNGTTLQISVGSSEESLERLSHRFVERCNATHRKAFSKLRSYKVFRLFEGGIESTLRVQTPQRTAVACLDFGHEALSRKELHKRLERFAKTGDVSAIGTVRYVYIEASTNREPTFFVTVWSDGPLIVQRMFPQDRDAPGVDVKSVERPPRSRRLLSAWESGRAETLSLYRNEQSSLSKLRVHYQSEFKNSDWRIENQVSLPQQTIFHAEKSGAVVTVVLNKAQDSAVYTTVLSSGLGLAATEQPSRIGQRR